MQNLHYYGYINSAFQVFDIFSIRSLFSLKLRGYWRWLKISVSQMIKIFVNPIITVRWHSRLPPFSSYLAGCSLGHPVSTFLCCIPGFHLFLLFDNYGSITLMPAWFSFICRWLLFYFSVLFCFCLYKTSQDSWWCALAWGKFQFGDCCFLC